MLPLTLHRLRAETLQFHQNPSFSVTLRRIYSCCYTLDASTNGNYAIYRNPRALGFLNCVVHLVLASNYYIDRAPCVTCSYFSLSREACGKSTI